MEQRDTPEFILEAFADPTSVPDIVRGMQPRALVSIPLSTPNSNPGILHTIFFHRFFPSVLPQTRDVLDLTLPFVANDEVGTLIDQRTAALVRQLEMERTQTHAGPGPASSGHGSGRGQIAVHFFEKRRRKAWYNVRGGDDEVCWERWTIKVTVAEPRTEGGMSLVI